MRTFMFLVFCALSCFCSKFALCDVVEQEVIEAAYPSTISWRRSATEETCDGISKFELKELATKYGAHFRLDLEGTSRNSLKCLDINIHVEKAIDDIRTVTEKIKDFYVSHEILSPREAFITNQPRIEEPSRYSIGLHFRSLNLMVTLNVAVVKCEAYNRTGRSRYGKILTRKDGVQIWLDYSSSASYSYHSGAEKTTTALQWITWPFKSLANKLAVLFNFLVEIASKVLHWVMWPFRFLKNQTVALYEFVAGVCSSLNQKVQKQFEDPIKIIEAVLEVIWMVVSPFIRAVIWVCEIIIIVKRYIKLKTALFLETYPAVLGYITTCKMIGEYVSKLLALWPWNWMDSIEYVGFTWVILYFSFALLKFAMMDEREILRLARRTDRTDNRH